MDFSSEPPPMPSELFTRKTAEDSFGVTGGCCRQVDVRPVCPQLREMPCASKQLCLVPEAVVSRAGVAGLVSAARRGTRIAERSRSIGLRGPGDHRSGQLMRRSGTRAGSHLLQWGLRRPFLWPRPDRLSRRLEVMRNRAMRVVLGDLYRDRGHLQGEPHRSGRRHHAFALSS
jgi:hypothetical protein